MCVIISRASRARHACEQKSVLVDVSSANCLVLSLLGWNGKAVEQPRCDTSRYGLRYQGAKLWNSLGDNFKDALTLNDVCMKEMNAMALIVSYVKPFTDVK